MIRDDFSSGVSLSKREFDIVFAHPLGDYRVSRKRAPSVFVFIPSFIRGIFEMDLPDGYSLARSRILGCDV